jgi:hypothetical protein
VRRHPRAGGYRGTWTRRRLTAWRRSSWPATDDRRAGRAALRLPVWRMRLPRPHARIGQTRARLRGSPLAMAADVLSGPGGLAAWLRQSQLTGGPGASLSQPLDIPVPLDTGEAEVAIPAHLRRAVTARHSGCAFPGCDHPASVCQIHHLIPRSRGGPTARPVAAALRLSPPHRHPPLELDPAPRRHDHRHQPGNRTLHSHGPPSWDHHPVTTTRPARTTAHPAKPPSALHRQKSPAAIPPAARRLQARVDHVDGRRSWSPARRGDRPRHRGSVRGTGRPGGHYGQSAALASEVRRAPRRRARRCGPIWQTGRCADGGPGLPGSAAWRW